MKKSNLKLHKNKNLVFFTLNFFFWFIQWINLPLNDANYIKSIENIIDSSSYYFVNFLFSILLYYLYSKHDINKFSGIKIIIIVFASSIIGAIVEEGYALGHALYIHNFPLSKVAFSITIPRIWYNGFIFFYWNIIYIGFRFYENTIKEKQKSESALLAVKTVQLELLKYQINPHFLFNTLNSARTLTKINPDLAEEMLTQISEFLRYSLSEGKKSTLPLINEIEAIKIYLNIEKTRFGDNLIVDYNISSETENYQIPVFLLLPLVENAVKHGMKTSKPPLLINIFAEKQNSFLVLKITNSGKWKEADENSQTQNTGTGLENVRKRLENLYSKKFVFEVLKAENEIEILIKIQFG